MEKKSHSCAKKKERKIKLNQVIYKQRSQQEVLTWLGLIDSEAIANESHSPLAYFDIGKLFNFYFFAFTLY